MSDLQVRGYSRFDHRAPLSARAMTWLTDLSAAWLLVLIIYRLFAWDPLPDWKFWVVTCAAFIMPVIVGKKFFRASLGERFWGIRHGKTRPRSSSDTLKGGLLTVMLLTACSVLFTLQVLEHPYWSSPDSEILLPAVVPPSDWKVLAFYYTLAPWPIAVGGHPVFYSVPYEVGPPKRFVGDITADWVRESVRLTIEGPKTPMEYQSRERTRAQLHECFDESPLLHPGCVAIRRVSLERHLRELRDEGYAKFNISWFSAENPGIPDPQRAQGIRLRATSWPRVQDRYILVTPNGLHETIELSYLANQEGELAERDLKVALGALRISEDLAPGRAWTESLLENVKLDQLPPLSDGEKYLSDLSDIQSSLVSMISVNPESFDAYYHLAGSSLLLLRYASKNPGAHSSALRSLAQAMVARMTRYGHDVDPASPRLPALDQLAAQAKQF